MLSEKQIMDLFTIFPRSWWGNFRLLSRRWNQALVRSLVREVPSDELMSTMWEEPWLRDTADGVLAVFAARSGRPDITGKEARDLYAFWSWLDPEQERTTCFLKVYGCLRSLLKLDLGPG